jgi:hypothetical protein
MLSFPFTAAEEFNSRPLLISSLEHGAGDEVAARRYNGNWQPGDTFFLMTDALACWALRLVEAGADPFALFQSVGSQDAFETLIADQRACTGADEIPLLKNDDVTLVIAAIA